MLSTSSNERKIRKRNRLRKHNPPPCTKKHKRRFKQKLGMKPVFKNGFAGQSIETESEFIQLLKYVHQELSIRYGLDVEWIEQALTTQELIAKTREQEPSLSGFINVDLGKVVKQACLWREYLPRVLPFYAIKSNPNINILRVLHILGVNYDCASKGEIDKVLSLGAQPNQIIYANPAKGLDHILHAKEKQVRMMTFDNLSELEKILSLYPEAELVLRIASNDTMSLLPFGYKFGASYDTAVSLINACKEKNANLIGISFHVGSGCYSPLGYVDTLRSAKQLFTYAESVGLHFSLLDIGGGFPGDKQGKITFEEIATAIGPVLDQLFSDDVQIIAEPGRFFCSASTAIALSVYSRREYACKRYNSDGSVLCEVKEVQYYVPDGVYGNFNNIIYDHAHPVCQPFKEPPLDATLFNSTFFGPTCDSIDVLAKNIHFPKLEVGDWVFFDNMGAYTVAAGSNFNGFESPKPFYHIINHFT